MNLYLVPYEGVLGAAAATSLSLAAYFYLFVRGLEGLDRVPMLAYLLSGGIVYTAHQTLDAVRLPVPVMLLIIAGALPLLFAMVGLFEQDAPGR